MELLCLMNGHKGGIRVSVYVGGPDCMRVMLSRWVDVILRRIALKPLADRISHHVYCSHSIAVDIGSARQSAIQSVKNVSIECLRPDERLAQEARQQPLQHGERWVEETASVVTIPNLLNTERVVTGLMKAARR